MTVKDGKILLRLASIGKTGKKWHIAWDEIFTLCGVSADWVADEEKELPADLEHICKKCLREVTI